MQYSDILLIIIASISIGTKVKQIIIAIREKNNERLKGEILLLSIIIIICLVLIVLFK